jgi:hypothetical protein
MTLPDPLEKVPSTMQDAGSPAQAGILRLVRGIVETNRLEMKLTLAFPSYEDGAAGLLRE